MTDWPTMTLTQVAELMKKNGDERRGSAIRAQLARKCKAGEFGDAAKKSGTGTAAWEVRTEAVYDWLGIERDAYV